MTRRDRSAIVHASQVHGCSVVQAVPGVEYEADAIITNDPSLVIGVKVADCCGIMLYDPQNKALGAVHSGWRGTAQNIVAAAILEMEQLYGTSPSDLLAGLSPFFLSSNSEDRLNSAIKNGCANVWEFQRLA